MDFIPKQYKSKPIEGDGAIKSRGISIAGFEPKISAIFSDRRVIWSVVLLALSFAVWGGLKGYIYYINSVSDKIAQEISSVQNSQNLELAQKIIDTDKTIKIYKGLLKNHIYSSQFFDLLEKVTIPQVQWRSLNLLTDQGRAQLTGRAASYSVLAKQIVSFEKSDIKVDVSTVTLTRSGVEFSATILFDRSIMFK